jgi:hypothetical protein
LATLLANIVVLVSLSILQVRFSIPFERSKERRKERLTFNCVWRMQIILVCLVKDPFWDLPVIGNIFAALAAAPP